MARNEASAWTDDRAHGAGYVRESHVVLERGNYAYLGKSLSRPRETRRANRHRTNGIGDFVCDLQRWTLDCPISFAVARLYAY